MVAAVNEGKVCVSKMARKLTNWTLIGRVYDTYCR